MLPDDIMHEKSGILAGMLLRPLARSRVEDVHQRLVLLGRHVRELLDVVAQLGAALGLDRRLLDREIVELILMAGFYIMLARLTETLGVETDPPIGSALIRDIEARVAAKKGMAT